VTRSRLIDAVIIAALLVASAWLGRLVYHNHLGGHAPNPLDAEVGSAAASQPPRAATSVAASSSGGAEPASLPRYEVLNVYPHDPAAYTQGLFWHDGALYEGTGRHGQSSLRKVELETGRVLEQVDLSFEHFGEGIALFDDHICQLTWLSNTGFVYDAASLEQVGSFRYETEGWGLTADDRHLIMSDGSENLYFLDLYKGERVRTLRVFDDSGGVDQLNELEFIDGFIWANVWRSDEVLRIDPITGEVSGLLAG